MTLAQLRAHGARVVASCLAIVIAVGFVVATLSLNATAKAGVLDAVGAEFTASALVVEPDGSSPGEPLTDLQPVLAALPGVAAVAADRSTTVEVRLPGRSGSTTALAEGVGTAPQLRWQRLSAGRLPAAPDEVAVSDRVGVRPGTRIALTGYPVPADGDPGEGAAPEPVTRDVTVVGAVDLSGDPRAGLVPRLFGTEQALVAWGADAVEQLRVAAVPGQDPTAAVRAATAGRAVTVSTGPAVAQRVADSFTGDASSLTSVLLVFGAIAVLVAGLVIANTFAVLLAQRTRELALLRCVGAARAQVGRSVLGEAAAVGLLASAAGVLAGSGLAHAVAAVAGRADSPVPLTHVVLPGSAVATGLVLGTVVTVLAAAAPARAATRVAPLAALRPLDHAPLRSRGGLVRLVLGLVLTVPATAAMALCAAVGALEPAVAAGALSFLGFLLLAQRLVPALVELAGRPFARLGGVPAQLAAGNSVRNPRRTAATATALVIGVTLTTAMVVGTASTRSSASAGLEASYPTDVVVRASGPVTPQAVAAVRGTGRVAAVALVQDLAVVTSDGSLSLSVAGVDPAEAAGVVRSQERTPLPRDGEVVLARTTAQDAGLTDGARLTLHRQDEATGAAAGPGVELTVRVAARSSAGAGVTAADARRLAPGAVATGMWVRLADGDPDAQAAATDDVTEAVTRTLPAAEVAGIASVRGALDRVLTTMLLVVTGLLAVAVVIALLGVGNTLALSVVERRQESGLLRALGLTRGQLRAVLAWEALLVAGVAAVLGVVLGTGYGLAGTASVLVRETPVRLSVPWAQVAGIVVVAAAAGVLASVLPARRAANTPPVAAIAD
ncbi:FtsX-like permease family protein [Kineococcus aurantiacus]|uniref:Putative ABC transport system permease protein n=1 Tax=Kineococcus aurantiacus TaxID=37633 RepID=A0A7Y9J2H0_9ACTN|nr:putative ABC transport system permease protein [Kineococcus aurantiacus]